MPAPPGGVCRRLVRRSASSGFLNVIMCLQRAPGGFVGVQQSRNTIACVGVVARQAQGYCFALDMCWTSALEDAAMESYQIVKILAATRIDVCAAPREEINSIYGTKGAPLNGTPL